MVLSAVYLLVQHLPVSLSTAASPLSMVLTSLAAPLAFTTLLCTICQHCIMTLQVELQASSSSAALSDKTAEAAALKTELEQLRHEFEVRASHPVPSRMSNSSTLILCFCHALLLKRVNIWCCKYLHSSVIVSADCHDSSRKRKM